MRPSTSKNRLLKLADFLDNLPPKRFNYAYWVSNTNYEVPTFNECGTVGCALGWATTIPSFKKLGLKMDTNEPFISGAYGLMAGAYLFGISFFEAKYLFVPMQWLNVLPIGPDFNTSPKEVANHIRRFVNWKFPEKQRCKRASL